MEYINEADIVNALETILSRYIVDGQVEDVNDYTDLVVDMNFDSLTIIQLIVEIEEELNVVFPLETLVIDELINYKRLKETVISLVKKKTDDGGISIGTC